MNVSKKTKNEILKLESEELSERKEAIENLTKKKNAELEELLIFLLGRNTSKMFQEGACNILGEIGSEKAIAILLECMNDDTEGVSFHAVKALAKVGGKQAVNPLLDKLKNGTNPLIKSEVIIALGEIGDSSATKALIKILKKEKDKFVRENAVKTLGKIGTKEAFSILRNIQKYEKNAKISYYALTAIQEIEKRDRESN